MNLKIIQLKEKEIDKVAKIASENFSGLKDVRKAKKWIVSNLRASPRMQYFIAKLGNQTLGYILWIEIGGFRKEAVWELEQIAIRKDFQGKGIGGELIKESLERIRKYLEKRKSSLKLIKVTTGIENNAQELYKRVLGAKKECKIKDFLRGDEIIMIKRYE